MNGFGNVLFCDDEAEPWTSGLWGGRQEEELLTWDFVARVIEDRFVISRAQKPSGLWECVLGHLSESAVSKDGAQ